MTPEFFNHASAQAFHALPILLDAAAKSAALLALAGVAAVSLRRASAASRHLVWLVATAALLLLPILSIALPAWRVVPAWWDAPSPVVAPMAPPPAEPFRMPAVTASPLELAEPAAPAAPLPPPPEPRWPLYLLGTYVAGVLACLVPLLVGSLSLLRTARRATPITAGPDRAALDECRAALRLRRRVTLLRSGPHAMPMTWGVWPFAPAKILLPAHDWSPRRLRVVLLHELAHVKRMDCATQLVTQLACALYWFNPLAWLAARRMLVERERACDDLVLTADPDWKPSDYAEHLLEIARTLQSRLFSRYTAIAMARPSALEGRLLAILDPKRNRRAVTAATACVAVALAAAVLVPVAMLKAEGSQPPAAPSIATADEPPVVIPPEANTADLAVAAKQSPMSEPTPIRPEDLIPDVREYRIGVSDLVVVSIFELVAPGQESVYQRRVGNTGEITFPEIGAIKAEDLSASELEQRVGQALEQKGILRDPRVNVVLAEARGNTFSIIAEPETDGTRTGTYQIPQPDFRILDAIAISGGISGRTKRLHVYRQVEVNGQQTQRLIEVPWQELINGDMRYNIVVRPGDIIRVPNRNAGFVYIMGEINRPGAYTVPGDDSFTALQAIASAGGIDRSSPLTFDHVRRGEDGKEERQNAIPVADLIRGDRPDIVLKPNDMLLFYTPEGAAAANVDTPAQADADKRNRETAAKLQEPVAILLTEDMTLEQAATELRESLGVPLWVNWEALTALWVERTTPLSVRIDTRERPGPGSGVLDLFVRAVNTAAGSPSGASAIHCAFIEGVAIIARLRDLEPPAMRAYDIRDLLVSFPSSAENQPAAQPLPHELAEQIVTLIQDTVGQPTEWQAYGGDLSTIRKFEGQLVVSTIPTYHREISTLLAQLRDTRSLQVNTEVRFLLIEETEFAAFDFALDEKPMEGMDTQVLHANGETPRVAYLDDLEVNMLIQASKNATTIAAPRLTAFSGQATEIEITAQDGKPIRLTATAAVSSDRKRVTMDIEPRIEQPAAWSAHVRAAGVPDRGTLLIMGPKMRGRATPEEPEAATQIDRRLLILIRPAIIIQNEREQRLFPGLIEDAKPAG